MFAIKIIPFIARHAMSGCLHAFHNFGIRPMMQVARHGLIAFISKPVPIAHAKIGSNLVSRQILLGQGAKIRSTTIAPHETQSWGFLQYRGELVAWLLGSLLTLKQSYKYTRETEPLFKLIYHTIALYFIIIIMFIVHDTYALRKC